MRAALYLSPKELGVKQRQQITAAKIYFPFSPPINTCTIVSSADVSLCSPTQFRPVVRSELPLRSLQVALSQGGKVGRGVNIQLSAGSLTNTPVVSPPNYTCVVSVEQVRGLDCAGMSFVSDEQQAPRENELHSSLISPFRTSLKSSFSAHLSN